MARALDWERDRQRRHGQAGEPVPRRDALRSPSLETICDALDWALVPVGPRWEVRSATGKVLGRGTTARRAYEAAVVRSNRRRS